MRFFLRYNELHEKLVIRVSVILTLMNNDLINIIQTKNCNFPSINKHHLFLLSFWIQKNTLCAADTKRGKKLIKQGSVYTLLFQGKMHLCLLDVKGDKTMLKHAQLANFL